MHVLCVYLMLICSCLLLNSCGFKLRGHNVGFNNIPIQQWYINGNVSDNLRKQINIQMQIRKAEVSNDIKNAKAVLEITENYTEQTSNINKGRISDIRLKYHVTFLVRQANADKVLKIPQIIEQFRDITVNNNSALAQDQKKKDLIQEMQYHAAERILENIEGITNINYVE